MSQGHLMRRKNQHNAKLAENFIQSNTSLCTIETIWKQEVA